MDERRFDRIPACGAYVLNFLVAIGILFASLAWSGIYPFGDRSFLTGDLMYQYVDFFAWLQNVLAGKESLLFSTSQALGSNAWGLYSYYLGSPLNLLIALFPEGAITDFVLFASAIKLGAAQACAAFFLRRRFCLPWAWCTALALGFAWSVWTATQLRNPQWLDALAFLPLAAWGVHELVRSRRWALFVLSVAGAIVCCWYTAYMLMAFMVLLFLLELWLCARTIDIGCDAREGHRSAGERAVASWQGRLRCAGRFVASMAAALALSAFTFVPTVIAMLRTTAPELDLAAPSPSLVSRLVDAMAARPLLSLGACACIALVLIAALLVASTRRIGSRAKGRIALAIIVAIGAIAIAATTMVHLSTCDLFALAEGFLPGLWAPDLVPQLYGGMAMLVLAASFLLARRVPMVLRAAGCLLLVCMVLSVYCAPLYVAWCGFKVPNGFYCRIAFLAVFAMMWLAACARALGLPATAHLRRRAKAVLSALLLIAVACDALVSVYLAWEQLYRGYPQSSHEAYVAEAEREQDELRAREPEAHRVAKDYARAGAAALNEGMARGYDEISSYSSIHDANAIAFLNDLGYCRIGGFSTRYAYPQLAMDSLLGVRYVYSTNEAEGFVLDDPEPNSRGARLFENPYALSLGYLISDDATGISFVGTEDPFQRQNILIDAFIGSELDPFVECEVLELSRTDGAVAYEVQVPAGCIGYAFVLGAGESACAIEMEGRTPFLENAWYQDSVYGIAGASDEAQTVTVSLVADASQGAKLDAEARCVFYALDMARFEQAHDALSTSQMSFEGFSGSGIVGEVVVDDAEDRLLMVSVPLAPGWSVTVNEEAVEPIGIAGGALTGIPVSAGVNRIAMSFMPPGLIAGAVISCATAALLMVLSIRMRKKTARRAA